MSSSVNYIAEAQKRNIGVGYSIDIPSIGKRISNIVIDGVASNAQENHITKMRWNPQKISLDNANVSVGTLSVTFIDKSSTVITVFKSGTIHKEVLTLERGFKDLDIADWNVLSLFNIYQIKSSDQNVLTITARDRMTELKLPIPLATTFLTTALASGGNTAFVDDTTGFEDPSGTIIIDNERITYGTISIDNFFSLVRSVGNDVDHDLGALVKQVITITDNPIDIMLQLMISPNGGVTGSLYDGLTVGLSIAETSIDIQSFEDVRDNSTLAGDSWKFELTETVPDLLKFLQQEIFEIANVRITVNEEGKFACSLLQEITIDQLGGSITEEDILVIPSVVTNSDRVQNRIEIAFDFDIETEKFENRLTFNDTDSQATFGVIEGPDFESKGFRSATDGAALALQFSQKYFRRVSQPFGKIDSIKTLWKKQFFQAGDKISLSHPKLMNFNEGKVGIVNQLVEVLSMKPDFERGIVTYTINNSPNLSANFAFISPSSLVASGVHTATVFDVETGEVARAEWQKDQVIALWLKEGGSSPIDTATILSVSGDEITLSGIGFSTIPTTAHRIRYADFDDVTQDQKVFAFFTDDNNDFADGTASYKIS